MTGYVWRMNEPTNDTPELPPTTVTIRVSNPARGPYVVEGEWLVRDGDGHPYPLPERKNPKRVSLCGCGRSGTWPVCDGTHKGDPPSEVVGC